MKKLFDDKDLSFGRAISKLAYCNPFLPERIEYEREALGDNFDEGEAHWNIKAGHYDERPNLVKIITLMEDFLKRKCRLLKEGKKGNKEEMALYTDMVLFLLYHRYHEQLQAIIDEAEKQGKCAGKISFFINFRKDASSFLDLPNFKDAIDSPHIFACFFQLRRAFHHIFSHIIGTSHAATKLRASVWQSIFTHDLRRYQKTLYSIMGDMTTLITGPSGTGKELVARAIGMSRYIPFDEQTGRFEADFTGLFLPLNISALTPTLVESELFGHKKGAFTGALQDRAGWLESCSPRGTVFLDEVGEIDAAIQVKLLRVLQERTFQRLGDTKNYTFKGKIIAATNRNLSKEMEEENFRSDFYYRLCSDIVKTPSLYDQLRESKDELKTLVLFIAKRQVGEEAEPLAREVVGWIDSNLGRYYRWPGNIRELEQCIRNIMIRNEYTPQSVSNTDKDKQFLAEIQSAALTAEELLNRYCSIVYSQTGSYQETGRRLGLDRRTVKARVDAGEDN
ncbi:MAG: sigma 54-interacting transcriptional regulator [Deltaproteobacteria bacterium]|nr:sigma 54-interacting transcriptional regulator [Deltaproteobacteria bacterium]